MTNPGGVPWLMELARITHTLNDKLWLLLLMIRGGASGLMRKPDLDTLVLPSGGHQPHKSWRGCQVCGEEDVFWAHVSGHKWISEYGHLSFSSLLYPLCFSFSLGILLWLQLHKVFLCFALFQISCGFAFFILPSWKSESTGFCQFFRLHERRDSILCLVSLETISPHFGKYF